MKLLDKDIPVSLNQNKVTHKNSEKPEKILEPRKSKDIAQKEVLKKPEKPRDIAQDKAQKEVIKKPEKPAIQEKKETKPKVIEIKEEEKPIKKIHPDVCSEKETITVCTKSSGIESHTICTDSNYGKYSNIHECVTTEKSRCSCCNAPVQQYDAEPTNYLKSCLKMEKQCCHTNSQESAYPNSYYDRNWDMIDCNCRRKILCNNSCRSRNEFR